MRNDVADKVRLFIKDNFWFRDESAAFADTESLLDAGLIDSTGILELVAFLESEFALNVADADIIPENLDSVAAISAYVNRRLGTAAAA